MQDNNLVQMSEIKREEINKRCIIFKKLIEKSAELVHLNLCVHEGKIGFVDQERWRIVAVWEPMYHRPSDDENDAEEYEKVLEQWKDSVALAEQVKRVGVQKLSEILAAEADGRCVVHGKWVVGGVHGNGVIGNWKCDICKGVSLKETLYCPNCGAKMDLEDK